MQHFHSDNLRQEPYPNSDAPDGTHLLEADCQISGVAVARVVLRSLTTPHGPARIDRKPYLLQKQPGTVNNMVVVTRKTGAG
jgi:hypothetical protein